MTPLRWHASSAALDWPILFEANNEVMIAPFDERKPGVYPILLNRNDETKSVKSFSGIAAT